MGKAHETMPAGAAESGKAGRGRAPVEDFSRPLDALAACHEQIRGHCETLCQVAQRLPAHGCDAWAQQAASRVLRYFDGAGRHHEEDEEHDLFPRMRAAATGQAADRVAALVSRLEREHRRMAAAWASLRDALESVAYGEETLLDEPAVMQFRELYRAHMAFEDAEVLPLAAALLDAGALEALGRAMAQRRALP